jgi:membrane protein
VAVPASRPRALRLGWRASRRGLVEFYRSNNLTFAASISFYSLVSLFPFLLLVLSIVGHLANGGGGNTLEQLVARALPSHFDFVMTQIRTLAADSVQVGVAGTLVLLWASMGVFGALTSAVNHAWGVEQPYGFFKHKLIAFVMLLAAGFLMVVALLLVGAVQVVEAQWFADALARFPGLARLTGAAVRNLPTLMFILVVGLVYYFAPNVKVRLRDVWFGAVLAGLLWRVAFAGFAWYVRHFSRFSVHGSVTAVVVILGWIYLSAVILLYGVEVTAAYARLRREGE